MENKTSNLWLIRFNNKYELDVVENIINKNINVSLIVGNFQTLNQLNKIQTQQKKIDFIDNNEICALNFKYDNKKTLKSQNSLFLSDKFYKAYYTAIQIMERTERFSGDISFEERNYAIYKQVEFWKKKIEEKNPTNVDFFDIPHTYYEQIIMAICEKKNIPCMMIKETNIRKSVFLNSKFQLISGYGGKKFSEINKEYFDMVKINKEKKEDIELNNKPVKIKFFLKTFLNIINKLLKNRNQKYTRGYFIKTGYFRFGFNSRLRESIREFYYAWNCIKLGFTYKKLSSKADYSKDFVYMPLISGFEAAFHPVASPLNYFIILDYLLNILPENYCIYIKEHPSQFRFRHHQRFARSKDFYFRIKSMKRVKFIDINENQYKLISKSRFVVGSSISSAAVQSAALKKEYRYYGFHFISNDFIKPLFNNNDFILDDPNAFHDEWSYRNFNSDAASLANKIMLWVNDNKN